MDNFTQITSHIFALNPFSVATWFVLATLAFFVWLFTKASRDPSSPVRWEHLIIDSNNDRTSPYKLGYLIGLIVGTWVIVALIDKDHLTFDMFGTYLTYLLGGAGVNSFVKKNAEEEYRRSHENKRFNRYSGDAEDIEGDARSTLKMPPPKVDDVA